MLPKTLAPEAVAADLAEVSEIRSVSEIREAVERAAASGEVAMLAVAEPAYSVVDPLEGDALSSSSRRRSEYPCAYDSIAFVEGARVLTITWLPPAI
jgi:hypothetical protein